MPQSLEVYAFHDRRVNGFLPVYDIDGRTVAEIKPSVWTPSFGAMDADGALLCRGRPRGLRRAYLVSDAGGTPLLELRSARFSQARTVVLADGRQLAMRNGRWPSRDWAITDDSGRVVLGIAAAAAPCRR